MKRSKIFLGLTTCLLGVAAFAASKAKFTSVTAYYLTTGVVAGGLCLQSSQINLTVVGTLPNQAKVIQTDPHYAGNLLYATATCIVPIYAGANN